MFTSEAKLYQEPEQELFHSRKEKEIQDVLQKLITEIQLDPEDTTNERQEPRPHPDEAIITAI